VRIHGAAVVTEPLQALDLVDARRRGAIVAWTRSSAEASGAMRLQFEGDGGHLLLRE